MTNRRAPNGFTLVEVMIALMIFGMIAAAGVALLSFSVRAQAATGAVLDDVAAVSRLSAILTADLAQAVDRPTRDEAGALLPTFIGGSGTPMVRLVRGGWSNVDAAPRASLQKVEYRLENGAVERVGYPALDGAASLPAAAIVDHVQSAAWRFRYAGAWADRWDGNPQAALPQAAELVLTRTDGTRYRLLFLVGTGGGRANLAPQPGPTPPPPPPGAPLAPR